MLHILSTLTDPTTDDRNIRTVIQLFSKAGDEYDYKSLDLLLDPQYTIFMNRLFGSKEVITMNRQTYLEKIKTKEFGGDKRVVTIESILLNGSLACAKVIQKGQKSSFSSLLVLVKTEQGLWKIVSDNPVLLY